MLSNKTLIQTITMVGKKCGTNMIYIYIYDVVKNKLKYVMGIALGGGAHLSPGASKKIICCFRKHICFIRF